MDQLKLWARQMKKQLKTLYFATQHPDMPLFVKILAFFLIGYALSPIDLIPDFIPVLGLLDDLLLLPLGIYICYRLIPDHVIEEARQHDGEIETKHQIYIVLFIILIWCLTIYFVGNTVFQYFYVKR